MNKIPLVDLKAQYLSIKEELRAKIDEVFESQAFIGGRFLKEFEAAFAQAHRAHCGAGVSSGTSAISLALEALGIGRDDEVVVPANTFIATAEAVCHVGAKPVFADVDPDTYNITRKTIEEVLSAKTRAVIPVHLYGSPCDMRSIMALAEERGLSVVEDCAQAHLARLDGRFVGTFGALGAFSFYPGKNLGAYGDAGFVLGMNEALVQKVAKLRDHGRTKKYEHDEVGYNHRMDGLQAAILSVKLKYLPEWTAKRREAAALYDEHLGGAGFKRPKVIEGAYCVYHLYVVEASNRDQVMAHLGECGIDTGIHYPVPLHLQPAFSSLGVREGSLPAAERASRRMLSLPIFPELTCEDIDFVCKEFLSVAKL